MKEKFREIKLGAANKIRLAQINSIIQEYQQQNYVLTLRQLYYQLVSRDIIPNKVEEYAKLSKVLKEGRMAGIVDWAAIEDRLRQPYTPNEFESPKDAMRVIVGAYALPRMKNQETYVEVWVEKDALSGVLKRVTSKYHIPILVNRGYSSVSAMYDAHNRFEEALKWDSLAKVHCRKVRVIYLGDFDPSGLDMIRDIKSRVFEFVDEYEQDEYDFDIIPIALTEKQIDQYKPPPNPAKLKDPRSKEYVEKYGLKSWEVDALNPAVLNEILTDAIEELIDVDMFNKMVAKEQADINKLKSVERYL